MAQDKGVFTLLPETVVLGNGITMTSSPIPGRVGIIVKYGSGGTLFIQGATLSVDGTVYGSTLATSQKYMLGVNEVLSLDISGSISLQCAGATTTFYLLHALSAGPLSTEVQ